MAVAVGIVELGTMTAEREVCFNTFVVAKQDRARRVAWRLVSGDEAAAEDVTQDAFAKAYQALDGFGAKQASRRGSTAY